uniref:Genome polyprotein n=1 Tax=Canine picodicistrovirus TaxID=1150861 RepID=H6VBU6_9PICO|nr:polyprotein P1 [Canine picodicistrovirus]
MSLDLTGAVASLLKPFPIVGPLASSLRGLASSWLSKTNNGLLNESGFEIGHGTSDRLLALTAGTGCISSQEAVTVRSGWAGIEPTSVPNPSTDTPTDPGPAGNRFTYTRSGEWSTDTAVDSMIFELDLPGEVMTSTLSAPGTTFGPTADRHALGRFDFVVTVTVNANPFTSGCMLLVALPMYPSVSYTTNSLYSPSQLPIFPHQFINLRTTNQATLYLPFVSPSPLMDPSIGNIYKVVALVYAKLRKTTELSGGPVTYTVSVAPIESKFHGVHYPINKASLQAPTRILPSIGAFSTTSDPTNAIPLAFDSQVAIPSDYLPGLTTSLSQPLAIPTRMAVISNTAGFEINASTAEVGTCLYAFPIRLGNSALRTTYLGNMARFFSQYTGELKFSLMCCANSMTKGRLLISFLPGVVTRPNNINQAMLGSYVVYDVGLNSTFEFPIPYISPTYWRPTLGFGTHNVRDNTNQPKPAQTTLDSLGVVSVWVYTRFQTPSANNTVPIDFIPFLSAGKGFSFRLPTAPTTYVPTLVTLQSDVKVAMGSADAARATSAPTQSSVDAEPVLYTSNEDGQSHDVAADDVWAGVSSISQFTSPDMLLSNFFGRSRLYKTLDMPKCETSGLNYTKVPIQWGSRSANLTEYEVIDAIMNWFQFCQADLRVEFVIYPATGSFNPPTGLVSDHLFDASAHGSGFVAVSNIPPGALIGPFDMNQMSAFPTVVQPVSGPITTFSVYIPFQSVWSALSCSYSSAKDYINTNWVSSVAPTYYAKNFGLLPTPEFCTLYFATGLPFDSRTEIYVSFHNIKMYIPRPIVTGTTEVTLSGIDAAFANNNGFTAHAVARVGEFINTE